VRDHIVATMLAAKAIITKIARNQCHAAHRASSAGSCQSSSAIPQA
tara:strand:- start:373 stop:510 length:138 start_codon:yes stop_codon:yes gene_type:complete